MFGERRDLSEIVFHSLVMPVEHLDENENRKTVYCDHDITENPLLVRVQISADATRVRSVWQCMFEADPNEQDPE